MIDSRTFYMRVESLRSIATVNATAVTAAMYPLAYSGVPDIHEGFITSAETPT